jgi:sugar phosphate isomerase/epimerase
MAASTSLVRSFAAARPEASSAWRCRLSTSSILFKSLPLEEACDRIAALGFEAVDIWSAYDKCPHFDDAADRLGPSGLKALLAKHHLQLCAFSVYVGGDPKYAELLGGVGGGVAIRGSAASCKPEELTAKMRAFLESLKPLLELAEKHNSRLAIENHGNALLDAPDSFKAFVDLNTSPCLVWVAKTSSAREIVNLQRLAAELLPPVFRPLALSNAAWATIRHAQGWSVTTFSS